MKQIWSVIRREYVERVKTRAFILSTLGMPLLMIGIMAIVGFVAVLSEQSERQIVLVDQSGQLGERVQQALEQAGYEVELAAAGVDMENLDQQVLDEELEAYIVLDDTTASEAVFAYRGKEPPGSVRSQLMRAAIVEEVVDLRLGEMEDGDSVRRLFQGGALEYEPVGLDEEEAGEAEAERITGMITGIAGGLILYIMMLAYGAQTLQSVLEEKQSRVVELVISSLRPWQLMLGKIVGVGAVGLTQVAIWIACVALLAGLALPSLIAAASDFEELAQFRQYLPGPGAILLLVVFFLLGYFLYSSLFAAVGAMCRNLIMMYPRAVMGDVPAWMVAASIVLMALTVWGAAWVAGRIYKVGILSQDNRPSPRELLRWIREA
ncbi:MAG: ABC transporter permease [Acidobacteriota bacterium]|nr:ABC transporter permease [Acidobacteriota bacterium]